MVFLRLAGTCFAILALLVCSMALMVLFARSNPSDDLLIALLATLLLLLLAWGVTGCRLPPKPAFLCLLMTCGAGSVFLLMMVSDRYASLSPLLVGTASVVAFFALGVAVSWRALGGLAAFYGDDILAGRRGNPFTAAFLFAAAGLLLFQPLVILVNARVQTRPPLIVSGNVIRAYETHGKGAANHIVLDGAAAAYGSLMDAGAFEVDNDTYRASPVGARKCLTIRTGLLRFRWWSLGDC